MLNFFKNFHNFYKEFGSYIPIFEKISWEKVFFVIFIVWGSLAKNTIVVLVICLVIYGFIYALESRSKKIADKEREEEERQKLILSNLSETRKENLKFCFNGSDKIKISVKEEIKT